MMLQFEGIPADELESPYVLIDFEAVTPTGRTPLPIELAAVWITVDSSTKPSILVNELIALPDPSLLTPADTRQTGITREMLADARSSIQVVEDLMSKIPPRAYWVAHNAGFDRAVLCGIDGIGPEVASARFLDTLRLARAVLPHQSSYSLDELARVLGLRIPVDRHRALADVLLTVQVFHALFQIGLDRHTPKGALGLRELMAVPTVRRPAIGTTQLGLFSQEIEGSTVVR
jgi:DNA polymerase-3 subunit epsilon